MKDRRTGTSAPTETGPRSAEALDQDVSTFRPSRLDLLAKHGILLAFLISVLVFSVLMPDIFFTFGNAKAILHTQSVLLIMALALTLPLAAGDFDLSVAANLGFTMTLIAVMTIWWEWPVAIALPLAIAAGFLIGAINGFFVVRLGVDAFVITLGTGSVISGLSFGMTAGRTITGFPSFIHDFAGFQIFNLPLTTYYAAALVIVLWYVQEQTPLGRHLYFVGKAPEAARLSGVNVVSIRWGTFIMAGGIAGIAGILEAGLIGSSDPLIPNSFLLPAYAAAFLGATTVKVGRFNAVGTLLAIALISAAVTGFQLAGTPFWIEPIFNGIALVVAVTIAKLASRGSAD